MKKLPIRSMICAPKGKRFVAFDLSQAESHVTARLAREHNMIDALTKSDIHTVAAGSALFYPFVGCNHVWDKATQKCLLCDRAITKLMRYVGKRYNHASSYRMGAERAAQVINKDSDKPPFFSVTVKQSKVFYNNWHGFFNLKPWWAEIENKLSVNRTLITTYGRVRVFYAAWGSELFKEATAHEPQSTVSDHFHGALHPIVRQPGGLKEVYKRLIKPYPDRKIVNDSHDSALLEVPAGDEDEVAKCILPIMLRPMIINDMEFTIPVDVEIGERYGELEAVA